MRWLEGVALWLAVGGYAFGAVAILAGGLFARARLAAAGRAVSVGALALNVVAVLARWIAAGHAPVMGAYENSIAWAPFIPAIWLLLTRSHPAARRATPAVLVAALLVIGNGLMAGAAAHALEPPYRSAWLAVHVTFAWIAFGAYLAASVLAGQYLRAVRRGAPVPVPDRRAALDELATRVIALGFVADTVMMASGAIWAHGLWGRYWGWDPIETWSLVSWLIYGVNLHLRLTLGWRGRRAAWIALASIASIAALLFGIGVTPAMHTMLL
ncbi:MAG TPA: cytochrome c biogenesis protein CcsA [Anaeromyxobacteraceae bacterium]|nr:cytochrome c biogenesis protein CcsA [Anaeromyxobacteraceae bacterium]